MPIIEAERVPDGDGYDELHENTLQMREELNKLHALQQQQWQQQRQNTVLVLINFIILVYLNTPRDKERRSVGAWKTTGLSM